MFEPIKERSIYYPFLPTSSTDALEVAAHIRDARLYVPYIDTANNDLVYEIQLTSITSESITFTWTATPYGESQPAHSGTITALVVHGIDASPATLQQLGSNYVLVDATFDAQTLSESTALASLRLHPDCFVFQQSAPILYVQPRTALTTDGSATLGPVSPLSGPIIRVEDGYNVTVSGDGSTILLTGLKGGGAGLVPATSTTFADIASAPPEVLTQGLRSINGIDGNVTLAGYTQVIGVTGGTIEVLFKVGDE